MREQKKQNHFKNVHGGILLLPSCNWSGPPCQPYSKMGLGLGEEDERFQCHEKFYEQAERNASIHVIENVPEYPVENMVTRYSNHGDPNGPWKTNYARLDPRLFGFGSARPRVYAVAYDSRVVTWDKLFGFIDVLLALRAQPLMEAKDFFWLDLPPTKLSNSEETLS